MCSFIYLASYIVYIFDLMQQRKILLRSTGRVNNSIRSGNSLKAATAWKMISFAPEMQFSGVSWFPQKGVHNIFCYRLTYENKSGIAFIPLVVYLIYSPDRTHKGTSSRACSLKMEFQCGKRLFETREPSIFHFLAGALPTLRPSLTLLNMRLVLVKRRRSEGKVYR